MEAIRGRRHTEWTPHFSALPAPPPGFRVGNQGPACPDHPPPNPGTHLCRTKGNQIPQTHSRSIFLPERSRHHPSIPNPPSPQPHPGHSALYSLDLEYRIMGGPLPLRFPSPWGTPLKDCERGAGMFGGLVDPPSLPPLPTCTTPHLPTCMCDFKGKERKEYIF